jgi:hypothetical protein
MLQQRTGPIPNQMRRRREMMDRMMEILGVDSLTAVRLDRGRAFVEARRNCRHCQHESECRFWLGSFEDLSSFPGFCPNVGYFQRCGLLGSYGLGRGCRSERRANSASQGEGPAERDQQEATKLIRKLLWLGMYEEASDLQKKSAKPGLSGRVAVELPLATD